MNNKKVTQKYPGIDDVELEQVKTEYGYKLDAEAIVTILYSRKIAAQRRANCIEALAKRLNIPDHKVEHEKERAPILTADILATTHRALSELPGRPAKVFLCPWCGFNREGDTDTFIGPYSTVHKADCPAMAKLNKETGANEMTGEELMALPLSEEGKMADVGESNEK